MQFSKRLDRFGDEIFAALNNRRMELEAQGMKIYNMSVGTPDFKTPEYIKKAVAEAAMDDNNWKYSLRDLPELLDAVCIYYKKRFDVELTPDMVMTVYGSQEGMGHLGMALCDEGDTVLLPDPCYPVFAAGSLMAGAVPYYYPLVAEHDFLPYVKGIPEEIANKAKYMVVSLPSNPVGSIATPGLYEEIVEFAKQFDASVEGEIGCMGASEGDNYTDDDMKTNPDEALRFAKETGIDALAISFGSSHGNYPEGYVPEFDFERLKEIKEKTKMPLVLHGGSGSGDENIKRCVEFGINKINVGCDFMNANVDSIKKHLKKDPDINYWVMMHQVEIDSQELVKKYIHLSGSEGKSL